MVDPVWGRKKPRQLCVALLRACAKKKDLCQGTRLHADILQKGLFDKSLYVARTLLSMYAKCGALAKAEDLLYELPYQDVFSWNAIIAGYVQLGKNDDALQSFDRMRLEGFSPDEVTFTCILKACGNLKALAKGEEIYDEIVRCGLLSKDVVLGTALVGMYANCGVLTKAQKVLDKLSFRDSFSWTTLIQGYTEQSQYDDALKCFERMQHEGILPDKVTFTCILKTCGLIGAVDKGEEVHNQIARQGWLGKDVLLDNALVDMYAKCGAFAKAQHILQEFSSRSTAAWNSLIEAYLKHEKAEDAIGCLDQMLHKGVSLDTVTYICALRACSRIGAYKRGEEIHKEIKRQASLQRNLVLCTALIDMYAKCGAFVKAREVLEENSVGDVVSWNALLVGYAQHGQGEDVLSCYWQMQGNGLAADAVTYTCLLKACSILGDAKKGEQLYYEIVRQKVLKDNIVLLTALVDMYANCGEFAKARQLLEEYPSRSIVSWNALLAGYSQQGQGEETINRFEEMLQKGLSPDAITFICLLKACGLIGEANRGKCIHKEIMQKRLLTNNLVLCTALVDMYAKCGELGIACRMLKEQKVASVVSWNVLIAGYAQQGQAQNALVCVEHLQNAGFSPNEASFTSLLNACSHAGLIDEGQMYFGLMITSFDIVPGFDHYACMIDLFGRAGHFGKAVAMAELMPSSNDLAVWSALLGVCKKWGVLNVGRWAFEQALQADSSDVSLYVCMANIYSATDEQDN